MPQQIDEADPRERRRSLLFHRSAVSVFLLLLLAALSGFFGKGPASLRTVRSADQNLQVAYHRFIHYQSPAALNIRLSGPPASGDALRLRLSRSFVGKVEIQNISPAPESEIAGQQFSTYVLRVETNGPIQITLRFSANHFGALAYQLGVDDGPILTLRQFSFP